MTLWKTGVHIGVEYDRKQSVLICSRAAGGSDEAPGAPPTSTETKGRATPNLHFTAPPFQMPSSIVSPGTASLARHSAPEGAIHHGERGTMNTFTRTRVHYCTFNLSWYQPPGNETQG
ncbi:hypothetical protein EYF80_057993 [Liparis tanakae]|uniref:Uncharacterized protein n=1 Tax=Liparis tanakae TaxID=230148 RepID=A0A4Z2ESS5_9TELE|nr:hypothetical protein EYF80_057993 [Liparis tanakae]